MGADLQTLKRHLGIPCPHFGKRGVVQLGQKCSQKKAKGSAPPKFNKYAGWVEWKNAIFLWVNAMGGSFVNSFAKEGAEVNWFVGGAATVKSPIVKRLLQIGAGSQAEKATQVLLFVRPLATEPYLCCGRCAYVGHNAKKKGFEFSWRLEDHAALKKSSHFQNLLALQAPGKGKTTAAKRASQRWA